MLDADQPAVAMDASGDFVVAWRGAVSQFTSQKDVTNIYADVRPRGISNSYNAGTYVPGQMFDANDNPICVRQIINPTVSDEQQLVFTASGGLPVQGHSGCNWLPRSSSPSALTART